MALETFNKWEAFSLASDLGPSNELLPLRELFSLYKSGFHKGRFEDDEDLGDLSLRIQTLAEEFDDLQYQKRMRALKEMLQSSYNASGVRESDTLTITKWISGRRVTDCNDYAAHLPNIPVSQDINIEGEPKDPVQVISKIPSQSTDSLLLQDSGKAKGPEASSFGTGGLDPKQPMPQIDQAARISRINEFLKGQAAQIFASAEHKKLLGTMMQFFTSCWSWEHAQFFPTFFNFVLQDERVLRVILADANLREVLSRLLEQNPLQDAILIGRIKSVSGGNLTFHVNTPRYDAIFNGLNSILGGIGLFTGINLMGKRSGLVDNFTLRNQRTSFGRNRCAVNVDAKLYATYQYVSRQKGSTIPDNSSHSWYQSLKDFIGKSSDAGKDNMGENKSITIEQADRALNDMMHKEASGSFISTKDAQDDVIANYDCLLMFMDSILACSIDDERNRRWKEDILSILLIMREQSEDVDSPINGWTFRGQLSQIIDVLRNRAKAGYRSQRAEALQILSQVRAHGELVGALGLLLNARPGVHLLQEEGMMATIRNHGPAFFSLEANTQLLQYCLDYFLDCDQQIYNKYAHNFLSQVVSKLEVFNVVMGNEASKEKLQKLLDISWDGKIDYLSALVENLKLEGARMDTRTLRFIFEENLLKDKDNKRDANYWKVYSFFFKKFLPYVQETGDLEAISYTLELLFSCLDDEYARFAPHFLKQMLSSYKVFEVAVKHHKLKTKIKELFGTDVRLALTVLKNLMLDYKRLYPNTDLPQELWDLVSMDVDKRIKECSNLITWEELAQRKAYIYNMIPFYINLLEEEGARLTSRQKELIINLLHQAKRALDRQYFTIPQASKNYLTQTYMKLQIICDERRTPDDAAIGNDVMRKIDMMSEDECQQMLWFINLLGSGTHKSKIEIPPLFTSHNVGFFAEESHRWLLLYIIKFFHYSEQNVFDEYIYDFVQNIVADAAVIGSLLRDPRGKKALEYLIGHNDEVRFGIMWRIKNSLKTQLQRELYVQDAEQKQLAQDEESASSHGNYAGQEIRQGGAEHIKAEETSLDKERSQNREKASAQKEGVLVAKESMSNAQTTRVSTAKDLKPKLEGTGLTYKALEEFLEPFYMEGVDQRIKDECGYVLNQLRPLNQPIDTEYSKICFQKIMPLFVMLIERDDKDEFLTQEQRGNIIKSLQRMHSDNWGLSMADIRNKHKELYVRVNSVLDRENVKEGSLDSAEADEVKKTDAVDRQNPDIILPAITKDNAVYGSIKRSLLVLMKLFQLNGDTQDSPTLQRRYGVLVDEEREMATLPNFIMALVLQAIGSVIGLLLHILTLGDGIKDKMLQVVDMSCAFKSGKDKVHD